MAIKYGFFNSVSGDRKYNAEDIGRYLQGIVSSGVYADTSSSLQVYSAGGMVVEVQPGRAMMDFHYMENDEPLAFTLAAGGTQARIDAVIMRLDISNRLCEIAVKQGTAAASPQAPAMSRTDTKKEYMLAAVYVAPLASSITQENITDTRPDNAVCGWVTGVIDQVDTSTLFAQWQEAYEAAAASLNEYKNRMQAEFDAWFSALTNELDVSTFIKEYRNSVTIERDGTTELQVGISSYVPEEDVIFVNLHGMILQKEDYSVTGTGSSATVQLNVNTSAGHVVEFRVLKSMIGSAAAASAKILAIDNDNGVLEDDNTALLSE